MDRVFALDPVTPLGMSFNAEQTGLFRMMMTSREMTRAVMATAAASLFVPESLAPNTMPRFREGLAEIQAFYERILEQTFGVSEGIWLGTPHNLNLERESGDLERRMAEIWHPHLVLWGEKDGWIAPADLKTMAAAIMKRCVVSLLLLLVATSFAVAQPFTRRSSQEKHDGLKKYYEIPDFKLGGKYDLADPKKWEFGGEGGTTLELLGAGKLRTAYIAVGTPRRNAAGEITNAVVISSYYSGDSTDMYEQWVVGTALSGGVPIIGSGRPIDTDRYYVVMVDPLGTWGASKPSDKLGKKFPQYSYYDMVQANYRLLRDHLKISNVALATGVSMGGTQTYVWGVMHPEYVQALMPIGGTTQSDAEDPVGNWTFQLMTAAIESDPVWQATKGDYYNLPKEKHPLPGVAFGWSVLGLTGYDLAYRTTQAFTAVQPEVFYWDPPNEKAGSSVNKRAAIYDAVDLVWRNRVGETHNINPYLGRIQSRTLVMHITNDLWLNFKLAQRAVDKIPGADLIAEESPVAHYGVFSIINNRKHDAKFVAFLEDVARLNKQQQFVAKNYRVASVADRYRPEEVVLEGLRDLSFPGQVRDGQGQHRYILADRLHGRVCRHR